MRKRIGILCIMLVVLTVLGSFSVCAEQTERKTEIVSARLSEDGSKLTVKVTVSDYYINHLKGRLLCLFEFSPSALQKDIEGAVPVASALPAAEMTFELDFDGSDPQRLYSKYVLGYSKGKKYNLLGNVAYIENPEAVAEGSPAPVDAQNIMGVVPAGESVSDRIGHAVVPVYVNELFADTPDGSVRYEYGDHVYYIDTEVLNRLDKRVRAVSADNRAVYLQLLLAKPGDSEAKLTESLYSSSAKGTYYAPNTADAQGVQLWSSLIEFLCRRYTLEEGNGRVAAFILGDNINEKGNFVSSATDLNTYIYDLARTVRITSTAIRSVCDGVGLYVDFGGQFSDGGEGAYSLREIFSELFSPKKSKAHNNLCEIPFGIFLDIRTDAVKFWEEEGVSADISTAKITPANVDFFVSYLQDNATLLYNGKMRDLIIGYTVEAEDSKSQETAILGAVYRAMTCKGISAFIYDAPIDTGNAGDSTLYSVLCTAAESDVTDIAKRIKELLTRGEYEALEGTVLSDIFVKRDSLPLYTGEMPSSDTADHIADFTDGNTYSFTMTKDVNTHGITTDSEGNVLRMTGHNSTVGAGRVFPKGKDLFAKNTLVLEIKPETADELAYMTLILKGTKDGEQVSLSSTVEVKPGEWNTLAFDVSGIDMLWRLDFEVESSSEGALTVYARRVTVYTEKSGVDDMAIRIALMVLLVALFFFIILLLILIRMRIKRKKRAKMGDRYTFSRRDTFVREEVKVNEAPGRKSEPKHKAQPQHQNEPKPQPKSESAIPVMPKTETKTFVVPPKHTEPVKRKTMSLGIEPVSKDTKIDIDKTKGE